VLTYIPFAKLLGHGKNTVPHRSMVKIVDDSKKREAVEKLPKLNVAFNV
jgi:hypothetical protein